MSFKLAPFETLGAVSYSPSIVIMALSCIISEIKRDIGQKSWFFHTPLYSTPPLGVSPSDYCLPVWFGKTRMMDVMGKVWRYVYPFWQNVWTWQTDRQTPHDGKGRAWCKHRAAKIDKTSGWNSSAWCKIACQLRRYNGSRNRKWNSNMADVCFSKTEVVISQLWMDVCRRNLVCW